MADGSTIDPETARRAADEILAQPHYQPPPESLLVRVLRWLLRQLNPPDVPAVDSPDGTGWTFGWVTPIAQLILVATVLFVAYHVVRMLLRHGWPRRRKHPVDDDETEITVDATARDAWDGDAATHEAAGRWREALAARYRATVLRLSDSGLVRTRPGSSSGEIRGQVQHRLPEAADPFGQLTLVFEDVWYGGHPANAQTSESARRSAEAVLTVVAERPASGDGIDCEEPHGGGDDGAEFDGDGREVRR